MQRIIFSCRRTFTGQKETAYCDMQIKITNKSGKITATGFVKFTHCWNTFYPSIFFFFFLPVPTPFTLLCPLDRLTRAMPHLPHVGACLPRSIATMLHRISTSDHHIHRRRRYRHHLRLAKTSQFALGPNHGQLVTHTPSCLILVT